MKLKGLFCLLLLLTFSFAGVTSFAYEMEPSSMETTSMPAIEVWYGGNQTFRHASQPFVNILGSVYSSGGIQSLSYSLNNGAYRSLSMGPDGRRLDASGDFNIDIPVANVNTGSNTVVIRAVGSNGAVSTRTVNFTYHGERPGLPFAINWSQISNLQNVAQASDGHWALTGSGVRSNIRAYDRLLVIGDRGWSNYEVTVPITIHSMGTNPLYTGFGVILRWNGHTDNPIAGRQPKTGWLPLGMLAWYRNGHIELHGDDGDVASATAMTLQTGVTYIFKIRAETLSNSTTLYSTRVWRQGHAEPSVWHVSLSEPAGSTASGAVALIAHRADITFGNVSVQPLDDPQQPPQPPPASGQPVSDFFTSQGLNTNLWTFINPRNDAKLRLRNNALEIDVPGGVSHDIWTTGIMAPRIMQQVGNEDFEVEVKFNSNVTRRYQTQGVLVQQDDSSFIRFEFHSDGSSAKVYAATFSNGSPTTRVMSNINVAAPMYMRIRRNGNAWLFTWSNNGAQWATATSFHFPMNVRTIGPYSGNSGGSTAPAHVGIIDYFRNTQDGVNDPVDPGDPSDPDPGDPSDPGEPTPPPTGALAAIFPFNEGSGSTTSASSPSNMTASIQGATWTTSGGRNVLRFSGNGALVNFGDIQQFNNTQAFTIAGWFNQSSTTAYEILMHKSVDGSNDISIATYQGSLYFEVGNGANSYAYWTGFSSAIQPNQWYHIAAVFDGTGSNNAARARLYVNGVARQLVFVSNIPSSTAGMSGRPFTVSHPTRTLNGMARDIALYSHALSASEVASLYGQTPDPGEPSEPSDPGEPAPDPNVPAASWPLGEGSGSTAADASGNGHHGTLHGGVSWTSSAGRTALSTSLTGYVDVGDLQALNNANAFTITGWFNQGNTGAYARMVHKSIDGNHDISIATHQGSLYVEVGNGSNAYAYWPGYSSTIGSGAWYHVAAVYDGSGASNQARLRLFVNGVERPLFYVQNVPASTANMTGRSLTLSHPTQGFVGMMRAITVWSRPLSAGEISSMSAAF